ncbi:MAG: hypothetical protein K940chlam8_00248 [Chlamydiae bacterium]|nr:hypothetical protein [Chlamydiota bacterium]
MREFFLFFSCCCFVFASDQKDLIKADTFIEEQISDQKDAVETNVFVEEQISDQKDTVEANIVEEEQIPNIQADAYFGDENEPQQEIDTPEQAPEQPEEPQPQPQQATQKFKSDFYYGSRFTLGGFYRYQDHAFEKKSSSFFGEADLLIPVLQSSRTLLFLDVRGLDFEGKPIEGNFGLGVRHMFENYDWMVGVYTFYDIRRTAHRNTFSQITAGLEVKTQSFTFDANGYFPVGDTSKRAMFFDKAKLVDAGSFKNILFVKGMELALWGFDGELGYNFWKGLSAFAGGFYFHRNDAKTFAGPMARLYFAFDTNSKTEILFDQLILDVGGSYDHVREWRFYAGLKLSWVIGEKKGREPKGLAKRMTEYVRRDYDVITSGNNDVAFQTFNKANGNPVLVRNVTNEAEFNQAITDQTDVVGIEGTIALTGDKTLNNGQTITGGYYVFDDGIQLHLSNGGQIEDFDILLGVDNTIRDLTFKSANIANDGTAHVGILMIDNINTDRNVSVIVQVTGDNTNIYLNNSTFSSAGQFILTNAIFGTGTLTLKQFNNNTFDITASANNFIAVDVRNLSSIDNAITTLNVEEMQGNMLTVSSGAFTGAKGILFFNEAQTNINVQQTLDVGTFANNTVNMDGTSAQAIFGYNSVTVNGTSATQTMRFDQVLSNTSNMTNSNNGFGLYFFNEQANNSTSNQTMAITTLAGNTVGISAGTGNMGIFLENDIATAANAAKLNVGATSSGGFFNNSIGLESGSTSDIALKNSATNGTIGIKVNSFGQTLSEANFNAEVDESGSNQGGITITP